DAARWRWSSRNPRSPFTLSLSTPNTSSTAGSIISPRRSALWKRSELELRARTGEARPGKPACGGGRAFAGAGILPSRRSFARRKLHDDVLAAFAQVAAAFRGRLRLVPLGRRPRR